MKNDKIPMVLPTIINFCGVVFLVVFGFVGVFLYANNPLAPGSAILAITIGIAILLLFFGLSDIIFNLRQINKKLDKE